MPEANLAAFSLEGKTAEELEAERRAIVQSLTTTYKGYEDPNIPRDLLAKLAVITSTLRRKNAGPPKKPKTPSEKGPKSKKDLNDILGMLS